MVNKIFTRFSIFLSFIVIIGCNPNEPDEQLIVNYIKEDITTQQIWHYPEVYVISKTELYVKSTLIIQAGAIVQFEKDCSMIIADSGYLSAQGSIARPVIFTSINDNKNSGNSLALTDALSGDWKGIKFMGENRSAFNMCEFYYGGENTIEVINNAEVVISYSNFAYNVGGNFTNSKAVINLYFAGEGSSLRYNYFHDNGLPLAINTSISIDASNQFLPQKNTDIANTCNTITVISAESIKKSTIWYEDEIAFSIISDTMRISSNASLLLGNNVTLKFIRNALLIIEGTSETIINNNGPGVLFTSIYDDENKGDSNGDGNTTKPAIGDWKGIFDSRLKPILWKNILYSNL